MAKTITTQYGEFLNYDGFVCRDNMGKLITPAYVTTHFKLMVDSNGLKHLRFHDLRHSCASLLVASGVPMKAVQEWLGHATYNITADYYSHLDFRSKMASANESCLQQNDTEYPRNSKDK